MSGPTITWDDDGQAGRAEWHWCDDAAIFMVGLSYPFATFEGVEVYCSTPKVEDRNGFVVLIFDVCRIGGRHP